MSLSLLPVPHQVFLNPTTGLPLAGGSIACYSPGTTTPKAIYSTYSGVPAANPFPLDSSGGATIFLDGFYDIALFTSPNGTGSPIWTILNVSGNRADNLSSGSGLPSGGNNGDFYFRTDGGTGTSIYMKRSGAWVAIL